MDKQTYSTKYLSDFLERHNAQRGVIETGTISKLDLAPKGYEPPEVTQFAAVHDTFLFSKLVSQMSSLICMEDINIILDLGAGSSIPTMRLILEHPDISAKVIAVDIDSKALSVSRRNAGKYNLSNQYEFRERDMLNILPEINISEKWTIIANPPYLPVPESLKESKYLPVNGGEDGTKYLTAILEKSMPTETCVALEWSSLSNPNHIISLIEARYEVLYVQAYDISHGVYTEDSLLKSYLLKQANFGKATLQVDEEGRLSWKFLGTIIRRL